MEPTRGALPRRLQERMEVEEPKLWNIRQNADNELLQCTIDRQFQEKIMDKGYDNNKAFRYNCKVVHNSGSYYNAPPTDTRK